MTRMQTTDLQAELAHFCGSGEFYRHGLRRNLIYSEGVRFLAEHARAYWLIDAIASYVGSRKMRNAIMKDQRLASLQFWRLDVKDREGVLTARADSGVRPFVRQRIPYTDFPIDQVDLWLGFDGRNWTLYLPSEH